MNNNSIVLGDGAYFISMFEKDGVWGITFIPGEPGEIDRKAVPGTGFDIGDKVPDECVKIYVKNLAAARVLQDNVNALALTLNDRFVIDKEE
jgi:hypothetical protein